MSSTNTTQPASPLIRRLLRSLTAIEWWGLLALLVVALVSGGLLLYQRWVASTDLVPARGGTYTEGIVATSLADVTPTLDVLTNLGLTQYNDDGTLVAAVAERWEVTDNGKTYTFILPASVSMDTLKAALEEHKSLFADSAIEFTQDQRVIFTLAQPFTPFLAATATPIFPYGPYQVAQQQKGIVHLTPNPQSLVGQPLLEEIVLRIYPDSFNLTQALSNNEIDGTSDVSLVENARLANQLGLYQLSLPRKILLFFNTDRAVVKDAEFRRRLQAGEAIEGNPEITLLTLSNPRHEQLAAQLVSTWSQQGVRVIVETRTATELANTIVPTRSYDALIYGLDFGGDPDPYPFWHSSQIGEKGLNLSNFANIDADRILQKARQTLDQAERETLYKQFDEIFTRLVPAIELEQVIVTFGVDRRIQGIQSVDGLSVADRYASVEQWYRKTERVPKQ